MNKLTVATAVAAIMTILVLYALSATPYIPAWAVFITWACFFHIGGDAEPRQAYFSMLQHVGLGLTAAWMSALIVLANPFSHPVIVAWWAPVIIGLVIGVLFRMGVSPRFAITPAIIYGYAGTFAFLDGRPDRFNTEALLSFTFDNVLITLGTCLLTGISAAYLNAILVQRLSALSLKGVQVQAPSQQ
ncbi:MAG TPA: DUF1097 domain-containing protein [Methylophilaceae bacterium]|nr:DUF1097 domain-containing protein [Methylophilaceae bacterium]